MDGTVFADARGCVFGPGSQSDSLLLVVYSNNDVILWDIQDLLQVTKTQLTVDMLSP